MPEEWIQVTSPDELTAGLMIKHTPHTDCKSTHVGTLLKLEIKYPRCCFPHSLIGINCMEVTWPCNPANTALIIKAFLKEKSLFRLKPEEEKQEDTQKISNPTRKLVGANAKY